MPSQAGAWEGETKLEIKNGMPSQAGAWEGETKLEIKNGMPSQAGAWEGETKLEIKSGNVFLMERLCENYCKEDKNKFKTLIIGYLDKILAKNERG